MNRHESFTSYTPFDATMDVPRVLTYAHIPGEGLPPVRRELDMPITPEASEAVGEIYTDLDVSRIRRSVESIISETESLELPMDSNRRDRGELRVTGYGKEEELSKNVKTFSVGRLGSALLSKLTTKSPRIRAATLEDVEQMVEVDIKAFNSVYRNYDVDPAAWKEDLKTKFYGRLEKTGGDWCQVLEKDGHIIGFIMSTPTSKKPEDFKSWEETTDNGTLETTFDPNGKNVYVVSLSVLPEATAVNGQDMLMTNAIGKGIEGGYRQGYFESRLPGLLRWVKRQCRDQGLDFDELTPENKDYFANEYLQLKTKIAGKNVPYDRLIRMYDEIGCKFIKVIPDAYQDALSMNYGVMCVWPIPEIFQKNKTIAHVVGNGMRLLSKSQKMVNIMKKVF